MSVEYIEQTCKSILHKIDLSYLPFNWGANPYRGCIHSCIYCFARYSHSYLDLDPKNEFESKIFVKMNSPHILRKEFSNPKWKKELVNLGSVCDPYQIAEEKYRLTREILKVFLAYKNPITIATKSDLILRDIDLLEELNQTAFTDILFSISSISECIQKEIEPRAPSTEKRLATIKTMSDRGLKVGVLLMPIAPFLNDSEKEIEKLFKAVAAAGTSYVIPGILYLQGPSKKRFFEFLEQEHIELVEKYKVLYQTRSPPIEYKNKKRELFHSLIKKYKLFNYRKYLQEINTQQSIDNWLKK
ncbi:MAG: radical SAM protein [Candidatus Thorarchaeota archaeon]